MPKQLAPQQHQPAQPQHTPSQPPLLDLKWYCFLETFLFPRDYWLCFPETVDCVSQKLNYSVDLSIMIFISLLVLEIRLRYMELLSMSSRQSQFLSDFIISQDYKTERKVFCNRRRKENHSLKMCSGEATGMFQNEIYWQTPNEITRDKFIFTRDQFTKDKFYFHTKH